MNQEQLVKIRLRKIIICSETRTKSHHQPDQRTVASAKKKRKKKFSAVLSKRTFKNEDNKHVLL